MEINVLQLSPSCSHAQLPTLPLSSYLKYYFDLNKNLTSGASESVTAVLSHDKKKKKKQSPCTLERWCYFITY